MSDVESHTICYLRDLLVTPSHKDPEVTAFLTHWAYEEFWHGEALDKVLRVHGIPADYGHIRNVRLAQGLRDRLSPINQARPGQCDRRGLRGRAHVVFALDHSAVGGVRGPLVDGAPGHPELTKLLRRVQKQRPYSLPLDRRSNGSVHSVTDFTAELGRR